MGSGDDGGSRLVVHHAGVGENLETGLRGFHLKVAEDQFVFAAVHLADGFGGGGGGVDVVPSGFEYGL